jgi:hypothetical protein
LVEMEYLFEHGGRRGQTSGYELAYGGEGDSGQSFLMGLLNCETLNENAPISTPTTPSIRGEEAECTGSKRPQNVPKTGGKRGSEIGVLASTGAALHDIDDEIAQNARLQGSKNTPSYRKLSAVVVAANDP